MEIINKELQKIVDRNIFLKEENEGHADTLDEKDEEIQKLTESNKVLTIKLAQKSNEVDTHQSRLSDDMNGLRGKLAKAENINRELNQKIDQTKINAMEAKDNQIALLKQDVELLRETLKGDGYIYEADKGWYKESSTIETQCDLGVTPKQQRRFGKDKVKTTKKIRDENFLIFINNHYKWVKPSMPLKKQAFISFEDIHKHIRDVSGTNNRGESLFTTSGEYAHWPNQKEMVKILQEQTILRYQKVGKHWDCKSGGVKGYHGSSDKPYHYRFDLKLK